MKLIILTILFCLVWISAFCATLNVPENYPTIHAAITASSAGDEIVVIPGLYEEHDVVIESAIVIKSAVPGEQVVIDAQGLGSVLIINTNGSVGLFDLGVVNGDIGVLVQNTNANSVSLERCTVSGNETYGIISGADNWTSVNLHNCVVSQNNGIGVFIQSFTPCQISNSEISGNADSGLFVVGAILECRDTIISDNTGQYNGGMSLVGCSAELVNVVFSGNIATIEGGGLAIWGAGTYFLESCSFSNCSAPVGAQVYLENEPGYTINSTFNCCEIDTSQFGGPVWDSGLVQITEVGCEVSTDRRTWGSVKGLYR